MWIIAKSSFGSLKIGLLNSGSSSLWSDANWNLGAPESSIWSLVVVNFPASAASASLPLFSSRLRSGLHSVLVEICCQFSEKSST